jgi:hypothetical protein
MQRRSAKRTKRNSDFLTRFRGHALDAESLANIMVFSLHDYVIRLLAAQCLLLAAETLMQS